MENVYIRIRGIIKKDDKYLLLKHWVDDRIPDPFIWEFVEGEAAFGESPVDAVLRHIQELLGVNGSVDSAVYTWSKVTGDSQCVGIAFLCTLEEEEENIRLGEEYGEWQWVARSDFEDYISNQYILQDLIGVEL